MKALGSVDSGNINVDSPGGPVFPVRWNIYMVKGGIGCRLTSKMAGRLIVYVSRDTKSKLLDEAWKLQRGSPGVRVTYDMVIQDLLRTRGLSSSSGSSGNGGGGVSASVEPLVNGP